jgi:hypothetical protein
VPAFSKQPLSYITSIGEHLIMLSQQLEPFAAHYSALSLVLSPSLPVAPASPFLPKTIPTEDGQALEEDEAAAGTYN